MTCLLHKVCKSQLFYENGFDLKLQHIPGGFCKSCDQWFKFNSLNTFLHATLITAMLSVFLLLTMLKVCGTSWNILMILVVMYLYIKGKSLEPTRRSLQNTLRALRYIFDVDGMLRKPCNKDDISKYRHNRWLAFFTGTDAMHTKLKCASESIYPLGHFRQLLYVLMHLNDEARSGNILDIGCGKGANALWLAHYLPNATIHGIDMVPHHVEHCKHEAVKRGITNAQF